MTRTLAALLLAASLATTASAQPPSDAETPLAAFLERRVPDELAADGLVLARDNLAIHVELVADRMLISLVDRATGLVVASTKIDQVPADREAAVATVTHVVADLMNQVNQRARPAVPSSDAAEQAQHERATLQFQRQAIRFGSTYDLTVSHGTGTLSRRWVAFQGDLEQDLPPEEFYRVLGHPELADQYDRRRALAIGGFVVAGIAMATSVVLVVKAATPDEQTCAVADPSFAACVQSNIKAHDDARSKYLVPAGIGGAVVLAASIFGSWFALHAHPITEQEAKTLADDYNQNLRRRLGLPVVADHLVHDIKLVPYTAGGESGFAIGGRF